MKRVYLSILFCIVLTGAASGQSDDLSTMASSLQALTGSVRTAFRTYESKISFIEPAGVRYTVDDVSRSGKRVSHTYEFNVADIDPYAIREQKRNNVIVVVLTVKNKQKLVKVSRNNEFQAYVEQALIYAKDIKNARQIGDAVRSGIPLAEKIMAERLNLDSYEALVDWFANNIKDVSAEKATLAQKLEPVEQGNANKWKFTRRELNPRGSGNEEVFEFNFSDINPQSIEMATIGRGLHVVMGTEFRSKVVKVYRNGKLMPYANRIEFAINDVDLARNLIGALKQAVKIGARPLLNDNVVTGALAEISKPRAIPDDKTTQTNIGSSVAPAVTDTKTSRIDIVSDPTGAEVEIDGNFVGSAPLSVDLTAGEYEIVLKKKGFHNWRRRFKVIGSNVGINAELELETAEISVTSAVDAPVGRTESSTTQTIPATGLPSEKTPKIAASPAASTPPPPPAVSTPLPPPPAASTPLPPPPAASTPLPPPPTVSVPPASAALATSEIPATPQSKSYDARKGTHDIVDLIENQIVEVEIQGSSITSVSMRVRSLVDYPVTVLVPVGSFFVSANPSAQNMVATAESRVTLSGSEWRTVSVSAACANRPRDIPDGRDRFTVMRSPQQEELAALMPVLNKANVNTAIKQAAVWIVTDNANYSDLGILISSPGNTRVIGYESAARAMRICSDAGIDISGKRIWRDRQTILSNLPDGSLKTWLQSFEEESVKQAEAAEKAKKDAEEKTAAAAREKAAAKAQEKVSSKIDARTGSSTLNSFELISVEKDAVKFKTIKETKLYSVALVSGNNVYTARRISNEAEDITLATGATLWPGSSVLFSSSTAYGSMNIPANAVINVSEFSVPDGFKANQVRFITENETPLSAYTIDLPVSAVLTGEILYRGVVKLEKCDEAIVSFVLSAEKDTVSNFVFELNGVYVQQSNGVLTKRSSKNSYSVSLDVKDGILDYTYPWRGENWRINIKSGLGTDNVKGEIKAVYVVSSDQIEDLGTALIDFNKIER